MTTNGTETASRVEQLELSVACLIWLHAEQAQQVQRLAIALAGVLSQIAQPQMQQSILNQLLGAQGN